MLRKLLKHIILLVNLVFVALMLVAGAARWLNPAEHTAIALMGLGFPILLLINVAFIVWWIVCRKWLLLLPLAAIVPFVPSYIDFPLGGDNEAASNRQIRILSYNVHNFGLHARPNHIQEMKEIMEFVGCENLDIACFQEYSSGDNTLPVHQALRKIFKYSHLKVSKSPYAYGDVSDGLATYSNFPIVGGDFVRSDGETDNVIIYTDIAIGSDTVRVINCHLQSYKFSASEYDFIEKVNSLNSDVYDKTKQNETRAGLRSVYKRMRKAYEWRVKQARTLANLVGESPYQVVVCGDFNETQSSYIYRLVSRNLHDSQRVASTGWRNTYRRFVPGIRIDYILYSGRMKCRSCNVPQVDYSDHRPVVGEYQF
ncbi:MAG: endonuclease/exonuclease/phosphatase family protein [Salinivirgaceae bacterium]|nr:endonuclease/exonuclease/phosphatase family protein [Salinivirgaceae bacterium]